MSVPTHSTRNTRGAVDSPRPETRVRVAVDIGGTFTDVVMESGAGVATCKVPTTPERPEQGFLHGLDEVLALGGIAPGQISTILHGTTLATNALIERRGAKTALLTTAGFRDSLEIGYEARFDQYDINLEKPVPLVPRALRFTVDERIAVDGSVLRPLDTSAFDQLAAELEAAEVEAVAIGFLHSYRFADHEQRARAALVQRLPHLAVSLSSDVSPELREYERFSTTCANAYVQPLMGRYLAALQAELDARGFHCPVMLVSSAASLMPVSAAREFPVRLVESGPSGGAVMAATVAQALGCGAALAYDMGGTTAKVVLIDEYQPRTARQFEVARSARFARGSGLPIRIPVVEMIEIGAGGGSVAQVDGLGRLAVGPLSAGATPGPACYDKGGARATVTDADCVLGRLNVDGFKAGHITLNVALAERALDADIGSPLGVGVAAAAGAVAEMVDENMANAARIHAAEYGVDPATYTLIAFGGAGPLHAARVADKLNITNIVVPPNPSVGSAIGFLRAPAAYEIVQSAFGPLSTLDDAGTDALLGSLQKVAEAVVREVEPVSDLQREAHALMRYRGQGHELEIRLNAWSSPTESPVQSLAGELAEAYGREYASVYGAPVDGAEIELVSFAVRVFAGGFSASRDDAVGDTGRRETALVTAVQDTSEDVLPSVPRDALPVGARLRGPVLIRESQTSTFVPEGAIAWHDERHNLHLRLRCEDATEGAKS